MIHPARAPIDLFRNSNPSSLRDRVVLRCSAHSVTQQSTPHLSPHSLHKTQDYTAPASFPSSFSCLFF